MDEFEQIAADLEKSIKVDEAASDVLKSEDAQAILKDPAKVREALLAGVRVLAKAKGAPKTDLSQEEAVKDEEVTDDEEDPAETPKKSGQGYKDTRPYVGKFGKGDDDHDDDDDGDEDEKPSFFGKKAKKGHKKPMKKSDDEEGDLEDVTEFMGEMAKAVNWLVGEVAELRKGQSELTEGTGIFGEVLHQVAENDPRRDTMLINMAKALSFVVGEVKDLRKSVGEQRDLVKAVAEMPGAPRVAGLALLKAEADGAGAAGVADGGDKLSKGDRGRLFQAAVKKSITTDEYKHALKTGDVSVLAKVK
jgi:hypothetical protein